MPDITPGTSVTMDEIWQSTDRVFAVCERSVIVAAVIFIASTAMACVLGAQIALHGMPWIVLAAPVAADVATVAVVARVQNRAFQRHKALCVSSARSG